MTAAKKKGRGNPAGPPKRGRRGHPSVREQKGLAKWIEAQLLEQPRPTYTVIQERLKETKFYLSRSAIARYGITFEARRGAMKLTAEKARILAETDDPSMPLTIEKALANLASTQLLEELLKSDVVDEKALDIIRAAARLQSSSSSRERASMAAAGKFRSAMRALQRDLEERLRSKPEILKEVVKLLEKAYAGVTQ